MILFQPEVLHVISTISSIEHEISSACYTAASARPIKGKRDKILKQDTHLRIAFSQEREKAISYHYASDLNALINPQNPK